MTWVETRLDAIARPVNESIDPRQLGDELVSHYSIPALDATGLPETQAASEIESNKQPLSGGEVLVSKLNPRKARVLSVPGTSDRRMVCSGEFIVLRPGPTTEGRYIEYLMLAESTRQLLDASVQSVTRSHQRVRPDVLTKLRVRVPAQEEQRAIADYLDTETARIDALITKKRRMIELLDEREMRLIDDIFGPRKDLPLVRLGYMATVNGGVTLGGKPETLPSDVSLPYLRVANVQHGRLDLSDVKTITVSSAIAQRCRLRPGDVLMTEGGDIDKLGRGTVWAGEIENCLHQNHVFAVRPYLARLLPEYLAAVTRTSRARRYFEMTGVQSTNLASTNASKVADFRLPLPSCVEQDEAVREFSRRLAPVARLSSAEAEQIDLLVEHRQALITAAVTGEFEVPGVAA